MNYFYISSGSGKEGISAYSRVFYEHILRKAGYIFIDSNSDTTSILSTITSRDHIHIEIGLFQKKETMILMMMLNANYKNIAITLHDPPLLKYPLHDFSNPLLNNISKFYDKYLNGIKNLKPYFEKIKSIYVLSRKAKDEMKINFGLSNVYYLPHIAIVDKNHLSEKSENNFFHFGFIGRNKGIEYALKLHQNLLKKHPASQFYVIGKAIGKENRYLDQLKREYRDNVHYLGYLEDEKLNEIFDKAGFAIQGFKEYKFYWPVSGSILYCLQKGKIVLTNKVNTIDEILDDGKNGIFLTGNLLQDAGKIDHLFSDRNQSELIKKNIYTFLLEHHSIPVVTRHLIH
jgi:glycosyltransferase involved in cell wall biosynthesis